MDVFGYVVQLDRTLFSTALPVPVSFLGTTGTFSYFLLLIPFSFTDVSGSNNFTSNTASAIAKGIVVIS